MKHLLSDEAFRSYLIDGYVVIDPVSLGGDFHDFLYQKAEGIYELVKNARLKLRTWTLLAIILEPRFL